MGMIRTTVLGCALIALPVAAASAADLGLPPPPQIDVPMPVAQPCCVSPLYLKGYLGMTSYDLDKIAAPDITPAFEILHTTFEGSGFFGLGLGYTWKDTFRFEVTSEYRNRSTFHGLDRYFTGVPEDDGTNEYTATYKAWVTLFNAYWDIGCWHGITPYVGGGVGYAKTWVGNFTDVNTPQNALFFAKTNSDGEFAWALYAGLAYDVTKNFTVDLGYRYLNLGDATSGKFVAYDNSATGAPITFKDVYSHDLMLGVRWKFGGGAPKPMPISWK